MNFTPISAIMDFGRSQGAMDGDLCQILASY